MKQVLVIVGAGSVGGHIAMNPQLYGMQEREIKFVDDDETKLRNGFLGFEVMGNVNSLLKVNKALDVVLGIAFPHMKRKVYNTLKQNPNLNFPVLVASNAWLSKGVTVNQGTIIYPGTSVNYNTQIEEFCVLNMNCAIGHDCHLGAFSSLAPGVNLGGNTSIGKETELGIGSSTKQFISIGDNVTVGGMSMVAHKIPSNTKVKGVPAKPY